MKTSKSWLSRSVDKKSDNEFNGKLYEYKNKEENRYSVKIGDSSFTKRLLEVDDENSFLDEINDIKK